MIEADARLPDLLSAPPKARFRFSWTGWIGMTVVGFWIVIITAFGSTSRVMIHQMPSPRARAASTNSCTITSWPSARDSRKTPEA